MTTAHKTFFAVLSAAAIVAAALLFFVWTPSEPQGLSIQPSQTITLDDVPLSVAVVDTPLTRERGLSGITGLAEGEGMLFVFEEDGAHSFWMKDMLFPIDILWLAGDGTVVHVEPAVSPDSYPTSFTSPTPARYVLEVAAGFAAEHRVKVGESKVVF